MPGREALGVVAVVCGHRAEKAGVVSWVAGS